MINNLNCRSVLCALACMATLVSSDGLHADEANKKKLKIVFLMGQSNMVGYSTPKTAWYLTQPMYVPPAETATAKSKYYNEQYFYWQGLDFAWGDTEAFNARGAELKDERRASRKLWRSRVYGNFSRTAQAEGKTRENNDWNDEEWGKPPLDNEGSFRSRMYEFLDWKAEEEGIYQRMVEHIQKVLANPGKYHPDYDPETGVELTGLIWFQGWNDLGNEDYGEQLVHLIQDFRTEVKAPGLPVVCGLVGHSTWPSTTFESTVNRGMLYAAKHEDLEGSVDVVNTVKYFPVELGLSKSVLAAFGEDRDEYKEAMAILPRSSSNSGLHYFGSAKFLCLTGNAMARSLVNLSKGGEPTIHKEAEALLRAD